MHRANPRARQHGNRCFRNVREINDDAIALFDFVALQHIRETANFTVQLLVCEGALVARFAFPDNCRLVPPKTFGTQMSIETVFGNVQLPADEPLCKRRLPLEDLFPSCPPDEFACLSRPKFCGLPDGFAVHSPILSETFDPRLAAEVPGWLENACLDQMRFNVAVHEQSVICPRNSFGKCARSVATGLWPVKTNPL